MKKNILIGNWQPRIYILLIWSKIMPDGWMFLQTFKWYISGHICTKAHDFRYKSNTKNPRKAFLFKILVYEFVPGLPLNGHEVICVSVYMGNCGFCVCVCVCVCDYVYEKESVNCVCRRVCL